MVFSLQRIWFELYENSLYLYVKKKHWMIHLGAILVDIDSVPNFHNCVQFRYLQCTAHSMKGIEKQEAHSFYLIQL